jgi:hypothetical protein
MIWKASVMVKFEAVYRNFPGQIEQYRESVIWARGFLNRYSNLGSSDRMSDVTHFATGAITLGVLWVLSRTTNYINLSWK